jgi:F0F1-type ATP synthase membrane subunit b/b'
MTEADQSTTEMAREEAAGVGQHARDAGGQVTQTAVDQARQVAAEAGHQARDLLGEAQGQARDQMSAQQQRAAQQLHSVADEFGQMAANGGQSGIGAELARQAADRMHGAASWLERR